ncbi:hypothetical protein [Agromyces bauzanensis]|uniref:MFS transporter n=1 Tax=Agromyces bauzanensis TaxID=1308924 RepID=A0A917P8Q5_9MICO|nr:hypothetical protein [Agromyces bauzanensis]GGJ66931.1 hypothetical protein GCM10011372_00910 [Agromyces bauzanensis]
MTVDAARLPRALRPFGSAQYRLLAVALSASLLSAGAWIVAVVWQVVQLGGTPVDLSFVAVGASLGLVLAVLFGGAADRIPQRWILLVVEIVRGAGFGVAGLLAAMTLAFARLGRDELAHPLDRVPDATTVTGAQAAAGLAPPVDEPHP